MRNSKSILTIAILFIVAIGSLFHNGVLQIASAAGTSVLRSPIAFFTVPMVTMPTTDQTNAMATITWDGGGATNNWSEPANWSGDVVPTNADSVVFDGTSTKDSLIDIDFTVISVNLNSGYSGTVATGSANLTVSGAFTQTAGNFTGGSGTLDFNGSFIVSGGTFTASSGNSFWGGNLTVGGTGSFEPNGGTAIFDGNLMTVDVAASEDFNDLRVEQPFTSSQVFIPNGDTLRVTGDLFLISGQLFDPGTVEAFGEVTIAPTFSGGNANLKLSGNAVRTVTIPAPISIPGLTVDAPNTSIATTGTGAINVIGNASIVSLASFSAGTADFFFASNYAQSGGTISNGSNLFTFGSNFTQTGGTFDGGSGTLDFNRAFVVSGGIFNASTGTSMWERDFTVSGTGVFEPNGGTAVFNEINTVIDVVTLEEFNHLQINKNFNSNSFTVAANDTIRVNGDLTLSNGLLNGTGTLEAFGGLTISPNFDGGTGRLGIGGNGARTVIIPSQLFLPNVIVNAPNADIDSVGTGEIVFQSLTVQNVNSMTNSTARYSITGPYNQSGGNVIGSLGIDFDNAFTQTGGNFTCGGIGCTIFGNMTLSGGTFTASTGTTGIRANLTVNGGNFAANGGLVVFNSTSSTVFDVSGGGAVDFNNVELNKGANTFSLQPTTGSTVRVNGTLTLTNGGIGRASGAGGTIEALGNVVIANTFDDGEGHLLFGGSATRTVTIPAPLALPNLTINAPNATINTSGTGTIAFRRTDIQNVASMTNGAADFNFRNFGTAFPLTISGGTFNAGSGSVQINANFTQSGGSFNGNSSNIDFNNVFTLSGGTFTASSGTTNFAFNFFVNDPGSFIHNNGTVVFDSPDNTTFNVTPDGTLDFNDVEINKSSDAAGVAVTFNDTLRVNGTLTITNGRILRGTTIPGVPGMIEALGNVLIASTYDGGDGHLFIGGNATRTITLNAPLAMPDFSVESPNTTVTTSGAGTISFGRTVIRNVASFTNGSVDFNFRFVDGSSPFIISGGTFNAGSGQIQINSGFDQSGGSFNGSGSNIDFNNIFTLSGGTFTASSGVMNFGASLIVNGTGVFEHNNGTVRFIGSFGGVADVAGSEDFNNLEINKASGNNSLSVAGGDALRVNGNLSLTNGQLSTSGGNGRIEAFGNVDITDIFNGGNGHLHILGNASRTITFPSPAKLVNLTINAPNTTIHANGTGIVDFAARTIVQDINLFTNDSTEFVFGGNDQYEQTGGTFIVGSGNITFGSLFTQSGGTFTGSDSTLQFGNTFTLSGGTFTASSGNTDFIQSLNISGTGVFEHNNGMVRFISSNTAVDVNNSVDLNNVEIDKSAAGVGVGLATNDILRIRGNLLLTNGLLGAPFGSSRFEAFGDVTISPTFAGGTGNLHYVGTGNQTYTNNGGSNPTSIMSIDKPSGILTAATDLNLPNTGLVINSGTLYLADGSDLTAGGAATGVTILANGRLISDSASTITLGGNLSNGGIIDLRGGGTCPAADTIFIRSTNGTQRSWTGLGTNRLVNVDVQSMGGTGTKTVYNGTDSGGNNASWVFDSGCPTGLTLSPLTASVQTGGTQNFTASGGFSPYAFSFVTNNSGGSINSSTGLYTAGTTAGVTDTIRVTDAFGDSTDATVNTFGAANKLAFTVQPTTTTAGQTISAIQVAVQDEFGNTVTNSNTAITLTIANNPNAGTLSGTVSVNAVSGIATFSDLSINRAGTGYTLQAVSGGLNSATSNAFDINVGAATQLAFVVQPATTNPNTTIAPPIQVAILDAVGNVVTTANESISIAIANNPNSGTLNGTLTRNAANGIAVFDDLSIDNTGNGYTLSVSSGGLSGATSVAFNIGSPFQVTNTNDSGAGSLRQAIVNSNATPGKQTITFSISGTAPFLIEPVNSLPDITDPVSIDARTQPGFTDTPIVVIRGTNLAPNVCGLTLRSVNLVDISGLVFGNLGCGIRGVVTNEISIKGNYFGVNPDGITRDTINGRAIDINAGDNSVIGGSTPLDRNVISGSDTGIFFDRLSNDNRIIGNFLGTNAAGTASIGNGVGISVQGDENTIGSAAAGEGNVISGNSTGFGINSTNNSVLGNLIGTAADGHSPIPNSIGIIVNNSNNIIGGIAPGEGNTIAFSTSFAFLGIPPMINTPIRGNSFHSNAGPGIFGLNPQNDPQDPDLGSNKLQNTPVIVSSGSTSGVTTVRGTFNSAPSQNFDLDFYSNPVCVPFQEQGRTYLGTISVATDAGGLTGFIANLPIEVPAGEFITATATDADGNTSVFGKCVVTAPGPFSISGRITDAGGNPIPNSLVRVDGFRTAFNADTNGNYIVRNLPGGRDYTLRPSAGGATFSPGIRTLSNLSSDQTGQDFLVADPDLSISGQVISTNNGIDFPLEKATIQLVGTTTGTVQTDANGRYSFNALTFGGNYQVQVTAPNFSFPTATQSFPSLTTDQTADFAGTISPQPIGRVVHDFGGSIRTMNADGTAKTLIFSSTGFGQCFSPSFSNNGQMIVFSCDRTGGGNAIFTTRFDGSGRMQISSERSDSPRFSPNGTRIAFASNQLIRIMNSDGSGAATIFNTNGNGVIREIDWSPDGAKIVFSRALSGNNQELFTINPNGSGLTSLGVGAQIGGQIFYPRFSPDGTRIAFMAGQRIALANSNGSGLTVINSPVLMSRVDWALDGSFLSFKTFSGSSYGVMETDGSNLRTLASGTGEFDLGPVFAPTTPPRTSVTVETGAVDITFDNVTTGGQTSVIPITPNSTGAAPNGFVLGTQAYEISTTAAFTPMITVCFTVQGTPTAAQFNRMSILHGEGGVLVDRTVSRNFTTKQICASVSSLSPFVLAEQVDAGLPSITGLVLDNNGVPMSGVLIGLTGTEERQTETNTDGSFEFVNLTANGNYNVSPKQLGYLFDEYNTNIIDLNAEETVFFEGAAADFQIAGTVRDGAGNPLAGISVELDGSEQGTIDTDANGNYVFSGLPADGTYVITPRMQGFVFRPSEISVSALISNVSGADFEAFAPTAAAVTIAGRVMTPDGNGIGRTEVTLNGPNGVIARAITNPFGYYQFDGEAGSTYIVTVSNRSFTFAEPSRVVNAMDNVSDLNFVSMPNF